MPFPWQQALYDDFIHYRCRAACEIPTGIGKTAVIPIWLLALAHHAREGSAARFPRRLIYVVNRRTVVDQATRQVEQARSALSDDSSLQHVANALHSLATIADGAPVAVSTLRGELADNAEWRLDPARPAIVLGTVDMIGSRLLFSAYGRGFRTKPLHAAFVGQDALVVHDEAHLEPAFQVLLENIAAEQIRSGDFRPLRVMALTATARGNAAAALRLSEADERDNTILQRVHAKKRLALHPVDVERDVAARMADLALAHAGDGTAILVFVRKLEDVDRVAERLARSGQRPAILTGTMRGLERERLLTENPTVARFFPGRASAHTGTAYLISTSAGEVGVDLSADHLVCDLTPLDSMIQRFGRVNRFGTGDARLDVVYATATASKPFDLACTKTAMVLQTLPRIGRHHDASPAAVGAIPPEVRDDAFTPAPEMLATTDVLLDRWALTSVRGRLAGRPPVADWLHGVAEWEPPETCVGWREEVGRITGDLLDEYPPDLLLEDFPLEPHELLRERSDRVLGHLRQIAARTPDLPAWLVEADGAVQPTTVAAAADRQDSFANCTIVLSPNAGGLSEAGLLNGRELYAPERGDTYDVSEAWLDAGGRPRRCRVWNDEAPSDRDMRLVRTIHLPANPVDATDGADDAGLWRWFVERPSLESDPSRAAAVEQTLECHHALAAGCARRLVERLAVPQPEASAVCVAAAHHDQGKARDIWQRSIRNLNPSRPLAKSAHRRPPIDLGAYRHEFGSLADVLGDPAFGALDPDAQDLVLHLIAAHHGRGRPHFSCEEAFDPIQAGDAAEALAHEVPRRFARLQRRYGRWGLAYLESLVRAVDALASSVEPATRIVEGAAEEDG